MPALEDRAATAAAEKQAIGRAAAGLVEDGDTVLLDGGTTTLEVARALLGRPVQVVTNSLPIAQLLASSKQTDLILIGGYVYPRTGVALGPAGDRDDAGHPGPQGDPGRGGDRGRGDLQLEPAPGRDRAADDGVRPGGRDRRRPHQVRPALALARLCGLDEIGAIWSSTRPARRVPHDRSKRPGVHDPPGAPLDRRPRTGHDAPPTELRGPKHEHRSSPPTATRSSGWSGRSSSSSSARTAGRRPAGGYRPNLVVEHLGAALPPDAGGRRRPLRPGLPAHADEDALPGDRLRRERDGGGRRPAAADDPGRPHPRPVPARSARSSWRSPTRSAWASTSRCGSRATSRGRPAAS